MRKPSLALAALLLVLAAGGLASCGRYKDYGAMIEGNRLHARGLYQDAAAAYLSVPQGRFGGLLLFNLANVYARLGEYEAAAELYARARKAGDAWLSAMAWYNEGLLLYEKTRYAEAYLAFRSSLALRPGDEDARRNLEIAWRDWKRKSAAPPEKAAQAERKKGDRADEDLLLLRRLETGRFRPGGKTSQEVSPRDY